MIELDYTLTRAHLLSFQKLIPQRMKHAAGASRWRDILVSWLILVIVSCLAIVAIIQIEGHEPDDLSVFAGFILGVVAMWAIWMQRAVTMRKFWLRDDGPTLAVHHTVAGETGLHLSTASFESICRWPAVLDLTEHQDILVVWIEAFHGFVIPRSAFSNEAEERAFLGFARKKIATVTP